MFFSGVILVLAIFSWQTDITNGIDYYSLSYNYFDEIAQAYCASKVGVGYAFALRRNCGATAPTCSSICASAKTSILNYINNQRTSVSCFNALNIRKEHTILLASPDYIQLDANKVHTQTYSYGRMGCNWKPNHCGPNYCCCKAYGNPPIVPTKGPALPLEVKK